MEIAVVGAGSLGSLVGGILSRVHDVTLVGRDRHVTAVEASGLHVFGAIEHHAEPAAKTTYAGIDPDLVVVTVKSYDTASVAETLAGHPPPTVLSLQNGMGNEEVLAERLGPETTVLAGTATYGAMYRGPGRVECTGVGKIRLGPWEGGRVPVANRVGDAFTAAGFDCTVADDMTRHLWGKLAVNAGINPVTALSRTENGALAEGPLHEVATDATREVARVARSCGVSISEADAVEALDRVVRSTAANTSSMARDVRDGRQTEIDAINGYVVKRAPATLPVPVNGTLYRLLVSWERARGLRTASE